MSKKIVGGSQLTDNWAAKCVILKKRFPRLTDGDLLIEPGNPGAEGKMFDKLTVKTGLGLDSLHQLVYNLLKDKDVPFESRRPEKEPIKQPGKGVVFSGSPVTVSDNANHPDNVNHPDGRPMTAEELALKNATDTSDVSEKGEEVVNKGEVTDEEVALREAVAKKKEQILENFYTLDENDLDYDQDLNGSFESMLDRNAESLGLTRDEFVSTINSL